MHLFPTTFAAHVRATQGMLALVGETQLGNSSSRGRTCQIGIFNSEALQVALDGWIDVGGRSLTHWGVKGAFRQSAELISHGVYSIMSIKRSLLI